LVKKHFFLRDMFEIDWQYDPEGKPVEPPRGRHALAPEMPEISERETGMTTRLCELCQCYREGIRGVWRGRHWRANACAACREKWALS
jgi:hypothetical protein